MLRLNKTANLHFQKINLKSRTYKFEFYKHIKKN